MITKSVNNLKILAFSVCVLTTILIKAQKNGIKLLNTENVIERPKSVFLENCGYDMQKGNLPFLLEKQITQNNIVPTFNLKDIVTRELTNDELIKITSFKKHITQNFEVLEEIATARTEIILYEKIVPIRLNETSGKYEYLQSYKCDWNVLQTNLKTEIPNKNNKITNASSSVLATGNWFKIGVTKNGIYKLDKAALTNLGLNTSNINPKNIKIYGNGGKLMPEKNSKFRYDDLQENAIAVAGEADGVFDNSDYVLFYGQATSFWQKQAGSQMLYDYQEHYFSDTSFYFITVDLGAGKRIQDIASSLNAPTVSTTTYDYMDVHEKNDFNHVKSGREFFGEKFEINTSYSFLFNVPNAVVGDSLYVTTSLLSRSEAITHYTTNYGSGSFVSTCGTVNITGQGNYIADIGVYSDETGAGLLNSQNLVINVTKQEANAVGWLNRITFNCRRNLVLGSSQFVFKDHKTALGIGSFADYNLINSTISNNPLIWNVSDPTNITNQLFNTNGANLNFVSSADSVKEFCMFNNTQYFIPKTYGKIANQNLHNIQQADFIIVTHPSFLNEANRIAQLHSTVDSLTYAVVTTQQVYNEFSSGTPDIAGIRDFARMLYKRPTDATKATKYLLLFGDGSYKNKDINASSNSALIPTYETFISWSHTSSFVSDDYFGMLDDTEGDMKPGSIIDIGIGRFPVKSVSEAQGVTAKIEHYYKLNYGYNPSQTESSCVTAENNYPQGDWRNWVCFIGDDEDGDLHTKDADRLANRVMAETKEYNVDKIFLDSYVQTSTPGGDRYPDVITEIDKRMEKGALIINYTGHGGELGLTEERVIEVPQILAWTNKNNMPLIVTATCEFSRFDDPDRTSAGEYCLLNPNGGAIGLLTTVRLAFSNLNYNLNNAFYNHALKPMLNGKMPHLGDMYRLTKRDIGFSDQYSNFVILGDPALKLSYPEQEVYTTSINNHSLTVTSNDTLNALSIVTISGFVGDKNGNKFTNFNGVLYPTIFDKNKVNKLLQNDINITPTSPAAYSFITQENVLYKGKAEVINGDFTFSFLIPKDITYDFGKGKISYYAHNGVMDANGNYNNITIGGSNPNAIVDNQGPAIKLYLNDEKFVSGGLTNEKPKLIASISDVSGVNTVGTGIGHDIVAVLDANTNKSIILNDYYTSDLNTYQTGKIRYSLSNLSDGNHTLNLKVWDMQNNSSTITTNFEVAKSAELALKHILNYPNPFTTKTKFFIEHNQCCSELKVLIQIYTITGKVVKVISQTINNEGFRFDGIEWNGKDEFGDKLAKGVYIYKITVTDNDNKKDDKIEKLVILN